MMETLVLIAVIGTVLVAAIAVVSSIAFAMMVDKKILDMKANSNSWADKQEKGS